ncbi:MAG: DNA/RNA non-specific endonuclease, partial [Bacteroidaceae bacterium]|nr:DNA/RNA non-specific endonuclease [Bacteroidaceae bacterium]
MGRKRKTNTDLLTLAGKYPKIAILVGVCLVGIYLWQQKAGAKEQPEPQEAATEETVPTTETTAATAEKGGKTKGNKRAKGLEIPAYLTDREEEIVQHAGFTLSYNRRHLIPNWVGWVLTAERVQGTEKRANNFQPDMDVKQGPIA